MFYKDGFFNDDINSYDPILSKFINQELIRQQNQIELIASENIVSKSVLQAQGSVLTNKYAEGLPGKRYYGGCEFVDEVEKLAIDRAKKLFMSQHPKPNHALSRSVSMNGSLSHSCSSHGTVSVCPASTRPPGPEPSVAIRLALLSANSMTSHLKPSPSRWFARSEMISRLP